MLTWALDTETTGTNPFLGCRPFLIIAISDKGDYEQWEAQVNPYTRIPYWKNKTKRAVRSFLSQKNQRIVMHNAKFDRRMIEHQFNYLIPWEKIEDTLVLSHVLMSGDSHKLKDLCEKFLDIGTEDVDHLRQCCMKARREAKKLGWRIAEEGDPHFPTHRTGSKSKGAVEEDSSWWLLDMWLPKAVAQYHRYPLDHEWYSVCQHYCFTDVIRTLPLFDLLWEQLAKEGYQLQYKWRMDQVAATYAMEDSGMTIGVSNLHEQMNEYRKIIRESEDTCKKIYDINLNSSQQRIELFYKNLQLPVLKTTKKNNPSTDTDTLKKLVEVIEDDPTRENETKFIKSILKRSAFKTALGYLEGYKKAVMTVPNSYMTHLTEHRRKSTKRKYRLIRPRINPTGTNTLRPSSSNPNGQNISKKGETNLRRVFCPLPGRVWYPIDYSNIEMRIFAYSCGDRNLIRAFEEGKSVHIEFAKAVYEDEWISLQRKLGTKDQDILSEEFKSQYKDTLYQWVKNGDFAIIYGATEKTANAAYHRDDAYQKIVTQLPLVEEFILKKLDEATDKGYIHTIGDYRLDTKVEKHYKLRSVACNYFVQGSARWFMVKASSLCHQQCQKWNQEEGLTNDNGYKIILDVHDELIFDFPDQDNMEKLIVIKELMECVGIPYGIPTLVEVDEVKTNWSEGKRIL